MALKVKSVAESRTKWADNAARSAEAFAVGASAAADLWATKTAGAADNFNQAITAPGIKERFRAGVVKAGAQKFKAKIDAIAKDRYAPGINAAGVDYESGVSPYLSIIAGLTLSARKPKGDPANYIRVEQIGKALNSKRLAMLGSGAK
jgi:hypothetical protein